MLQKKVRVLVLRAAGINCDAEMVTAWEKAGAEVDLKHVNEIAGPQATTNLDTYTILGIPGGFAYGDHLGAGKLLANELIFRLKEPFSRFVDSGRPVLGVCNGFQVLARAGLFGDLTLLPNQSGKFECRWTSLQNTGSNSIFLRGIEQVYLPVAHGEGRVVFGVAPRAEVALKYCDMQGNTQATYPWNPNGSAANVGGVSNPGGTVFGLMPHPERFVSAWQHPRWTRQKNKELEGVGLQFFKNAVDYASREL
jgi:phosphoribosylformylglycinamidine synthase subunit PurQ / glutaminase